MSTGKSKGHGKYELLCDGCGVEIFVDINMVMLHDKLWLKINGQGEGDLCDKCIEKKLGRDITAEDFMRADNAYGTPLCNLLWLQYQAEK
jgi:hypothetical protein